MIDWNPSKICFAGDWHSNLMWALQMIEYAHKQDAEVIIHTGDFGYKFTEGYLNGLNNLLQGYDLPLMFVDGNHDDQRLLKRRYRLSPAGVRVLRSHIWYLPRGYRWEWQGVSFLALGGAYSVDRKYRDQLPGRNWWPEEEITLLEAARISKAGPADVMITHDCPSGVEIPRLAESSRFFDREALVAADRHRDLLREVVIDVQPKKLIHGHYHKRYEWVGDLGYGPLHAIGLDCDGSSIKGNLEFWYPQAD